MSNLSMDAHLEKNILRIMVQTTLAQKEHSVPNTRKMHRNQKIDGRKFL